MHGGDSELDDATERKFELSRDEARKASPKRRTRSENRTGSTKRDGASTVYLFRVHDGVYGDPVYRALLKELIGREPRTSAGFRFHWGDYLPFHSLWNVRVKVNQGVPRPVRSFTPSSLGALKLFYRDLFQSAVRTTVDPAIADEMPDGYVWAIAISNQHTPIGVVDAALRERVSDVYLGAMELDPTNPVHVALTFDCLPLYGFYRGGHLALRLDGDIYGDVSDSPPIGEHPDLPWYAGVGSRTYSTSGEFIDTSGARARLVIISQGRQVEIPLPPAPLQEPPSKRGLGSLSLLMKGLSTYGVEQLLTGLQQLGGSALQESIARWPSLPDFASAVIDEKKLYDFALNPNHPVGKHKAALFRAALGFERHDAPLLMTKLREALLSDPVIQGLTLKDHGVSWHLDLTIEGLNANVDVVRTAWMVDYQTTHPVPRLTSLRVHRNQA